jgi:hypothetical protein
MPLLAIGIVALVVVIVAVVAVIVIARRQDEGEKPPESMPTDFVAPVSSGGYHWRAPDESPEEFHKRIQRENAEAEKKP